MEENNQLLKAGIAALKTGQREKAHKLLMRVIEQDERNERAWLWLSGTVATNEDRRICLDNVIAINPDNKMAQKGLAKLGPPPKKETPPPPQEPEPGEPEDWSQPYYATDTQLKPEPKAVTYDDVWSSTKDICAYCANPVERNHRRCTKCNHKLIGKELRRYTPSKYHRTLFTLRIVNHGLQLIVAILLILLFQALPGLLGTPSSMPNGSLFILGIVGFIIGSIPSGIVTAGIYFRKAWAYWLMVIGFVLSIGSSAFISIVSPLPPEMPTIFRWVMIFFAIIGILYQVFVFYALFMAWADFEKIKQRRIVVVNDRLRDPYILNRLAKQLAKKGMWASAVAHWQRAVGNASGSTEYLQNLARGYTKLGFYDRSLDTLTMALDKAHHPKTRINIEQQIKLVQQFHKK